MTTNILTMTWINRVLMIPFIITLMLGVIDFGFFYYSALIALLIGPFQFFFIPFNNYVL
ncbi:hypothetical protein [uncultured Polaribacter sp.]|uniref:hypothetical protein n=1 Tax=uncultured Polaribacter sp. TaxID=174711 RepID=UPI00259B6AF4|nr:hypothetical protein [uncultured Polaribacter sp.]